MSELTATESLAGRATAETLLPGPSSGSGPGDIPSGFLVAGWAVMLSTLALQLTGPLLWHTDMTIGIVPLFGLGSLFLIVAAFAGVLFQFRLPRGFRKELNRLNELRS